MNTERNVLELLITIFNLGTKNFIDKMLSKSKIKVEEESRYIYQIQEFDGKLWLTYNGALICPMTLFSESPIDTLNEIRILYVERNSTEE